MTAGTEGAAIPRRTAARRLLALAVVAALPWTVVVYSGGYDLLFPWGVFNSNPPRILSLPDLFRSTGGRAPARLTTWALSTAIFLVAAVMETIGVITARLTRTDGTDRRLVAGLLVLAAVANLRVTLHLARIGETALPLGVPILVVAAWWRSVRPP
ncbi:hypothetical protein BRD17_01235 [Halobacteriales archaeon SW_7_68_16]|nr:MAG: hypothetical protein BRD17_01235 [Halobacteriales archaeon SW_7_68_16]